MMNPSGSRRLEYLEAMGIQAWSLRAPPAAVPEAETSAAAVPAIPAEEAEALPGVAVPVAELRRRPDVSRLDWDELQAQVAGCTLCELHSSRTQTVFGVGNRAADWLVIGEAPGKDEDQQGEPFVGRAGQLLNAMLQAIGLQRQQVYIANILKCRPPNNRDPKPEEIAEEVPERLRPYLGGYLLAQAPEKTTAGDVIRALEGSILPVQCVAEDRCVPCNHEDQCTARGIWEKVRDRLVETLDGVTLADLL